jgi:hypothetical protein
VKLEVRCCCQPQKLLGWLEVPDPNARRVMFRLSARFGYCDPGSPPSVVQFDIATIHFADGRHYRAVKAEGAPLELLRRIRSFREAPKCG